MGNLQGSLFRELVTLFFFFNLGELLAINGTDLDHSICQYIHYFTRLEISMGEFQTSTNQASPMPHYL